MYIEKICKNISDKLQSELNLDDDKKSIVEYGIFALFNMGISILLVALTGLLIGVIVESLIISFTGAILRKFSGGAHASTSISCSILGVIISVLPAKVIKYCTFNTYFIIIIGFFIFAISYFIIYRLAPVDSPNKPIKKLEKIKKLKKGSIIILTIYMVIVIFNIIIYYITKNNIFLVYSICIYVGTLWQVFTLTKLGHIIVNILDLILINILNILRGSKNEKIKQ